MGIVEDYGLMVGWSFLAFFLDWEEGLKTIVVFF
jgi:hypothetical protein